MYMCNKSHSRWALKIGMGWKFDQMNALTSRMALCSDSMRSGCAKLRIDTVAPWFTCTRADLNTKEVASSEGPTMDSVKAIHSTSTRDHLTEISNRNSETCSNTERHEVLMEQPCQWTWDSKVPSGGQQKWVSNLWLLRSQTINPLLS